MGLVEELFGKKEVDEALTSGVPFKVKVGFRPLRLAARKNESVELLVDFQNVTKESLLASVVVSAPKGLGLDSMGLNKARELRVGYVKEGEQRSARVSVFGSTNTTPGPYKIDVTVLAHYRDYAHVLNSVRKTVELRVI